MLNRRQIDLTAKEFELLRLLISHPNRVFTRDFLLEHIWGYDYYGSTRTVDMHISRLREKIEDDPASPTYIVTVRSEEHTSELQSRLHLVCRLLLEKKK